MHNNEMEAGFCSLCYIIPPQVLSSIAQNSDDKKQRETALRTMQVSQTFRMARLALSESLRPFRLTNSLRRLKQENAGARLASGAQINRRISDAQNTENLPGQLARSEGDQPTNDPATDEAYDGLGNTYDLYFTVYGRNSIDGNGLPLDATVHFGDEFNNAFWDGRRMVFGDGDNTIFNRFTIAEDITAHELTHGVIDFEGGLIYWGQSGALNEHIADVFGSLVKQYVRRQSADTADWLIGEGLWVPSSDPTANRTALRSMKAPGTAFDDPVLGKDDQPAHMQDFVSTFEDNGGVHINSGIPNRAFYLAATGIGGNAWEKAGLIWYTALRSPFLRPRTRFIGFARLTARVAQNLYGLNSVEHKAVTEAWNEVGLLI